MPPNSHGQLIRTAPSDDASGKTRRPASQRSDESRKENKESKESHGIVVLLYPGNSTCILKTVVWKRYLRSNMAV